MLELIEFEHRGELIMLALLLRSYYRRRRRSKLPYREPRFSNRCLPDGWLPPSLRHRVQG
ncbi:MAG: RRXRR domain-containing protein, partial [Deltaproteobacteria bacterium]|nr:RRXRR domain-containing protein [Deltaproteobacteria bacterium]